MLTFIAMEVSQVLEQLVPVTQQDFNDRPSFVWIGNKYLHCNMTFSSPVARLAFAHISMPEKDQIAKTSTSLASTVVDPDADALEFSVRCGLTRSAQTVSRLPPNLTADNDHPVLDACCLLQQPPLDN